MMKQKTKQMGVVYAMKDGGRKVFSQYQWNTGIPQRVGWVEVGNIDSTEQVETERVDIQTVEIPSDDKVVEETPKKEVKKESEPSLEQVREYLNGLAEQGKIKKPHHATGEKKLRQLYHENYKQEE